VWYNLHESNEQCELEHGNFFVVLARKKKFPCSNSYGEAREPVKPAASQAALRTRVYDVSYTLHLKLQSAQSSK